MRNADAGGGPGGGGLEIPVSTFSAGGGSHSVVLPGGELLDIDFSVGLAMGAEGTGTGDYSLSSGFQAQREAAEEGSGPVGTPFRRGDANGDGSLNVVDPIRILGHLLAAPTGNPCSDAMDVDDLGTVEISDAILLLDFLFQRGSPPPAAPYGECGADNTADDLPCDGLTACQ